MRLISLVFLTFLLFACGGEGTVSISSPNSSENVTRYSLSEGSDNDTDVEVSFTAETSGIISYQTYDVEAVAKSDYIAIEGSMEVSAGKTYQLAIEVLADKRVEADERFGLRLNNERGEWLAITIDILNDDFPIITVKPVDATEGDIGTGQVQYEISLSESTISPFPLTINTQDTVGVGYGLAGTDYTPLSQELIFLEDQMSKVIDVEIFGDFDIEPDEQVVLFVSHLNYQSLTSVAVIRSDDFPGQGAPTFIVNEGRSTQVEENSTEQVFTLPFAIDDSGGFTQPFLLNYQLREYVATEGTQDLQNDMAQLDRDFGANLNQLTIIPGQETYTANFTINDDTDLEQVEILELVLFNDAGVEFGLGRIYISDNEAPEFNIYRQYTDAGGNKINSEQLRYIEGSDAIGEHKIMVELVGDAGYDFDFEYVLRMANLGEVDAAIDADDLVQSVSGTAIQSKILTIAKGTRLPAGNEKDGIFFTIDDDAIIEANESFFIELKNINGTPIGTAVEVEILNDDLPALQWVNENPKLPATSAFPFLVDEGDDLILSLQLIGGTGLGDAALEDFTVSIERQLASAPTCSWRANNQLENSELNITDENDQDFIRGSRELNFIFQTLDDADVECDEVITIVANINSKNEGVDAQHSDEITLTVVNTDKAQINVYGFTESESSTNAGFKIELTGDVNIDAEFVLSYAGAELDDASFQYQGNSLIASSTATAVNFSSSGSSEQERVITAAINDDLMVELDEAYQLSFSLTSPSVDLPLELRQCDTQIPSVCTAVANLAVPAIVQGKIINNDFLTLQLQPKSLAQAQEQNLTLIALTDPTIAYPYEVILSHPLAADIPEIRLSASDRCLLLPSDDCANNQDYQIADTIIHDGISDTLTTRVDVNFQLLNDDEIVEPDESAKLEFSLNNPASVSSYIIPWVNQQVEYGIVDNDKLEISITNSITGSFVEGDLGTDIVAAVSISWDKDIASNVPAISLGLLENCDETIDQYCLATTDTGLSFSGDVEFNKNYNLHDSTGLTAKNITGNNLGITVKGDNTVEADEAGAITVNMNDLAFVAPFLSSAWVEQVIPLSIINNDQLSFVFDSTSASLVEGVEGQAVTAGIQLSWDKNIANNVPDIIFSVAEVCDNTANSHCVSDITGQDISITNTSIIVHQNGSTTHLSSGHDVGIFIVGDDLVEPHEQADFLLDLQNEIVIQDFLSVPWFDKNHTININNDDVISAQMLFVDDVSPASGEEDTDKDLSAGNDVGLVVTWGDVAIADNADDLLFEIIDSCTSCGAVNDDYVIAAGEFNLLSSSASGQKHFSFSLTPDAIVEPDETINIKMKRKSTTPDHYFSTVPINHEISALDYTINNDDKILLSIVRSDALLTNTLPESTTQPLNYQWLGQTADNLPALYVEHNERCDNDDGDATLSKCLGAQTSLNNSPADIALTATTVINVAGVAMDASSSAASGFLNLSQNDDSWVEIDEALSLNFSIPNAMQSYIRFDGSGSGANPTFNIQQNYQLIDNDQLSLTIATASSIGAITDESAADSIHYPLTITNSVEQDVAEISLNLVAGNVPGTVYAQRSLTFADTADYRVFYGSLTEANLISSSIVIKAAGEVLLDGSSEELIIAVGDDDMIEPDETVAFSLSENNAQLRLFDNLTEVTAGNATTERTFDILLEDTLPLGIHFASTLAGAESLIQAEGDSDQVVPAIISGLQAIDATVGDLTVNVAISCKVAVPLTCDASEINGAGNIVLDHSTITDQSLIDLTLSIAADDIIEPNEVFIVTLSTASNHQYFDFSSNASREFTVLNDDYLTMQLLDANASLVEGDNGDTETEITLTINDEGAGVEGLTALDYTISHIDASPADNAEAAGSNKDFDFSDSVGSRTISLASMVAPASASITHTLATINTDHHIEADEILSLTIDVLVATEYTATSSPLVLAAQYTLADDDFLTLSLSGLSWQDEDSGVFKVRVCDKQGAGIENDFSLDLAVLTPIIDGANDEFLAVEKQAILNADFTLTIPSISVAANDISNANAYLGHDCALVDLPLAITTDSDFESNEWLGIEFSSAQSHLCAGGSNTCLQQNAVIVNDELLNILDSGIEDCIKTDGTIEAPIVGVCSDLSEQDAEVERANNAYTYLTSAALPVLTQMPASIEIPPPSYDCIQDNNSGYVWSIVRLPSISPHSGDGKVWLGSIMTSLADFDNDLISASVCGLDDSKDWQIPSVEQLIGSINYAELESDAGFSPGKFNNELIGSDSIYWTRDACDTDADATTLEYWAVNMKNGTVSCSAEANTHLVRAIYDD